METVSSADVRLGSLDGIWEEILRSVGLPMRCCAAVAGLDSLPALNTYTGYYTEHATDNRFVQYLEAVPSGIRSVIDGSLVSAA